MCWHHAPVTLQASFIWAADLPPASVGSTYRGLMHVTDMLPTLQHVATGGSWVPDPGRLLDGYDQWEALLSGGESHGPRSDCLISYCETNDGAPLCAISSLAVRLLKVTPEMRHDCC